MEDASVRAGLHHDAGPLDTQRGNLTAGGRPGQVVPAVQEQSFQPASPDTIHSKQLKVRACRFGETDQVKQIGPRTSIMYLHGAQEQQYRPALPETIVSKHMEGKTLLTC